MRIYLPVRVSDLATGSISARRAHAVTASWRSAHPSDDEEDGELVALLHAAADSVGMIGAADGAVRVVVAADVAAVTELDDPQDPTAVAAPDVDWSRVVSLHLDDPTDEQALRTVRAAAEGDDDAVDAAADLDLLWFDVSERDALRASFGV